MGGIKLREEQRQCEMGPISVRGQKSSRQRMSEVNLSVIPSQTYFRVTPQLRIGHWTMDEERKVNKYLQKLLPPY